MQHDRFMNIALLKIKEYYYEIIKKNTTPQTFFEPKYIL